MNKTAGMVVMIFGSLLCAWAVGCGENGKSKNKPTTKSPPSASDLTTRVRTCLEKSGTKEATTASDLGFTTQVKDELASVALTTSEQQMYSIKPVKGVNWRVYVVPKKPGVKEIDVSAPLHNPSKYELVAYLPPPTTTAAIEKSNQCLAAQSSHYASQPISHH